MQPQNDEYDNELCSLSSWYLKFVSGLSFADEEIAWYDNVKLQEVLGYRMSDTAPSEYLILFPYYPFSLNCRIKSFIVSCKAEIKPGSTASYLMTQNVVHGRQRRSLCIHK